MFVGSYLGNRIPSSNRTFMELKFANLQQVGTAYDVLIVPLWN